MSDNRTRFETPPQEIALDRVRHSGLILDVGGGGEGIVSRVEGSRVCSVDVRLDEIREARIHGSEPQWIVADAQHLPFRDGVFGASTLWFSLEYMRSWDTKRAVVQEIRRVLESDAIVSLLASKIICSEDIFVIHLNYTLPDGTISQTGYGVWGGQNQSLQTVTDILQENGLRVTVSEEHDHWFRLEAAKDQIHPKTLKKKQNA